MSAPWATWDHIVKIDPDKTLAEGETFEDVCATGTDALEIGGTTGMTEEKMARVVEATTAYDIPVYIEPSNVGSVVHRDGLDGYFVPIVLNAYVLCVLLLGERAARRRWRLAVVIPAVISMDVVLDPAAVALGFWTYVDGGAFYGVPLSNYAGWVLSATVAVVVLDLTIDRATLDRRLRQCAFLLDDLVSFVILWGGINAVFGNWLPALVAAGFGLAILRVKRFDAELLRPAGGLYVPRVEGRER